MQSIQGRPNIVLILADDMGYSDIGCYGSEIRTPNLDYLSEKGVRFTQMYNCARCCPSRASLLTGLYPHQAGIGHMTTNLGHPSYQGYLNDRCVTIPEALKSGGYRTFMSGKWHVGLGMDVKNPDSWNPGSDGYPSPTTRGFDSFYGTLAGCGSYYNPHTLMRDSTFILPETENYYYTDAVTGNALSMIKKSSNSKKPFFLYLSYTAPHWPLHALPEDIAKYEGKYRKGWDQMRADRYDRMVEKKVLDNKWRLSPRDRDSPPWLDVRDADWEDMRMAVYAAQVDRMDQGIGRIVNYLEEESMLDNTLILFLSDNGGCAEFLAEDGFVQLLLWPKRDGTVIRPGNFPGEMPGSEDTYMSYDLPWANVSNAPFRLFKHWVHEGGIATPFIAHWPDGINKSGTTVDTPAHFVDIMATCLEVAGISYPKEYNGNPIQEMEGESLISTMNGTQLQRGRPLFWEHEGNAAVRDGDWKMVRKYPGQWELYNMEADRTELIDRIDGEKDRKKRLLKDYEEWAERCGVVPVEDLIKIAPAHDFPTFENHG